MLELSFFRPTPLTRTIRSWKVDNKFLPLLFAYHGKCKLIANFQTWMQKFLKISTSKILGEKGLVITSGTRRFVPPFTNTRPYVRMSGNGVCFEWFYTEVRKIFVYMEYGTDWPGVQNSIACCMWYDPEDRNKRGWILSEELIRH